MGILNRMTSDQRYPGAARVSNPGRTLAGVAITPDSAMMLSAVWAAFRYLSQTVAVLPWHVKKDGKTGPEIQSSHGVDYLLWKRPSKEWSSFQFRETLTHWALRWGNGYAEIEQDQLGRPFAMWPIHPERVRVCRATDHEVDAYGDPIEPGDLYYEIDQRGTTMGGATILAAKNMFHIRGFGEGPVGVNVIAYAAQSLGWARAAQLFGAAFFGNGMNPAGVVINKKPLKPDGLKRQKAEFDQLYKGPNNANRTAFLDNEADWKPIGFNAQNSQLIEVHQFLIEEQCRWTGAPPHKVMHLLRATFTNIESQGIEVVVDSISPWVKRFEDEAEFKLFGQNRQKLYTKIDMRALMRGDMAARIAYYKGMTSIGAYSPNRVLELEDENTLGPEGDIHTMQGQNVTLKQIAEGKVETAPGAPPAPTESDDAEPATPPEVGEDEETQARIARRLYAIEQLMGEPAHV
ncbi:phage portal protein, HK97 family [Bradyrhizobium sp. YR681]|uniref:phage portal protein n=1 Tax=Bradyrhizobium sp. YR681 TaxID=1144344 RepID=UPI0002710D3A|nr:phage portal protein [Bradyrhizobium sp. YR681]EJN11838.1 phage portal protein, HK97 family [Bradyrhizobium sp. YR681]